MAVVDVPAIRLLQSGNELASTRRTEYPQRRRTPVHPAGDPKIGDACDVIVMKVREEYVGHLGQQPETTRLEHALTHAGTGIYENLATTGLDENRGAVPIG